MIMPKLLFVLICLLSSVSAIRYVNESHIIDFITCINTTGRRYNYTIEPNGGLLIQPFELRDMDREGIDFGVHECVFDFVTSGNIGSVGLSGNVYEEDDPSRSRWLNYDSVHRIVAQGLRFNDIPHDLYIDPDIDWVGACLD
ncbi:hypothetical protein DFJ63DRAFT_314217 [Scheffersomyces coipomensis]|uniref:uncharacterized protein n=1 Tax=Scheffersomyces coipomensis TaxID=1788519 RepID=UPI00315CD114